jgi:hypothetical protein
MTDQEICEVLARELMGWEYRMLSHGWYDEKLETFIPEENWNPLAQTPDGYFQCFGPGGVVEKMREKDLWLEVKWSPAKRVAPGTYMVRFVFRNTDVSKWGYYLLINRAACLAAMGALKSTADRGGEPGGVSG